MVAGNKKILIPRLITLVGAIALFITLFMPFASANSSFADDISLAEFAKMYLTVGDSWQIYTYIIIGFGFFALMALIFSAVGKPIPVIIFDILSAAVFHLLVWDMGSRGRIPSSNYDWGIAHALGYIAAAVVLAGAISMLVTKVRVNRGIKRLASDSNRTQDSE